MSDHVREATPSDPVRERERFDAWRSDLLGAEPSLWQAWQAALDGRAQSEPAKPFDRAHPDAWKYESQPEPAKPEVLECDQCGKTPAPLKYSYHDGGRWHTEPICEACLMEQRPAKPEAPTDAARFHALQNMPPLEAQAYFWHYSGRSERAKAIDNRELLAAAPKEQAK